MPDMAFYGKLFRDSLKTARAKVALASVAGMGLMVSSASAAGINWTTISDILAGIADTLLPGLVDVVSAAVPLLITLAIVGFIMSFLDKIVGLLNFRT